jgi:hypothetical protein
MDVVIDPVGGVSGELSRGEAFGRDPGGVSPTSSN